MKTIEVNKIKGNFYGGLPYSINWDFNGGENPSKLKISVVNEKGQYGKPNLSFVKKESIQLDNFTFNGYLIAYNFNYSVNQRTLDLEYIDFSIDLEKYFVVLNTKHASKYRPEFLKNKLIIVGKPYHPCDSNMDSLVLFNESSKTDVDWCDPCPFMPPDKYKETCNVERMNYEFFPIYYTFNELITAIKKEGFISIGNNSITYDNFIKRDFEGSLKNVLNNWCEELGLSYYFNPIDNRLYFIDRSKNSINIPNFSPSDDEDMIDLNISASLENTFSRGYISTYEKIAEKKEYDCKNERMMTLQCLVLQDLYSKKEGDTQTDDNLYDNNLYNSSGSSSSSNSSSSSSSSKSSSSSSSKDSEDASDNKKAKDIADVEELLTAVSYLGEPAHNAFTWFWYYQIKTAQDLKNKYLIESYEEESTTKGQKKILKYFGNMKIYAVYSATDEENEQNRVNFVTCKNRLDRQTRSLLEAECNARGFTETNPGYYFAVVELNEEFFQKQVEDRIDRAENFLGKYWYKNLNRNWLIPGANNNNGDITVTTPDGASAKWYRKNEQAESLPIFGFGHDPNSKIGKLFKDIPDSQLEIEKKDKAYWEILKTFGPDNKNLQKAASSFILMDRQTKWFPDKRSFINYEPLFKWYANVAPNVFADQDGRPKWLFNLYPEAVKNKNIRIVLCRDLSKEPDGAFDSVEFSTVDHPLEAKKRQQRTVEQQTADGNTTLIKKGPWGLNGRKCVKIKLPGIDLFCPVQCFGNNEIIKDGYRQLTNAEKEDQLTRDLTGTYVDLGVDDERAGYRVFTEASQTFPKLLPKIKYLYINPPDELKNVSKVDYYIKDLSSEQNMDLFKRDRCIISETQFKDLAKKYENFYKKTQSTPIKKASFKLAGAYPEKYNIEEGLVSIQISVGDDGTYTSYSFEDQIIKPPSDQVLADYIRLLMEREPIGGQKSLTSIDLKDYKASNTVSKNYNSVQYDLTQERRR